VLQTLQSIADTAAELNPEIILVDNVSEDGTVEAVREKFPAVKIFANTSNQGFSQGNNQGMKAATGDLFFLLNPDTELRPAALQNLLREAENEKKVFVLGPRLLNSDGSLQISAWKMFRLRDLILEAIFLHRVFRRAEYPVEQYSKSFSPGMLSGAALLFPRALYEKIGGLDPELFWMEDTDFCYRAKEAGAEIRYCPDAEIVHHSGQSAKKNLGVAISNQLLSKLKFLRKHRSGFAWFVGAVFCFLHIVSRVVIFSVAGIGSATARAKGAAYRFAFGKYRRYIFAGDKSLL
jgi:hypothetical protein